MGGENLESRWEGRDRRSGRSWNQSQFFGESLEGFVHADAPDPKLTVVF